MDSTTSIEIQKHKHQSKCSFPTSFNNLVQDQKKTQPPALKCKNTDIQESRSKIALLRDWVLYGISLHFKKMQLSNFI